MEFHDGIQLPTFTFEVPFGQAKLVPFALEWIYSSKIPRVDNYNCWDFLLLTSYLKLNSLENIIFQYVNQRVTEFQDHFDQEIWSYYIGNVAIERPEYLKDVLKTAYIDILGSEMNSDIKRYEFIQRVIEDRELMNQPLDEQHIEILMQEIQFQNMNDLQLNIAVNDGLSTMAKLVSISRKSSQAFVLDQNFKSIPDPGICDSGLQLCDESQIGGNQIIERCTDQNALQQIRMQLQSTIGSRNLNILSPNSSSDKLNHIYESEQVGGSNDYIQNVNTHALKERIMKNEIPGAFSDYQNLSESNFLPYLDDSYHNTNENSSKDKLQIAKDLKKKVWGANHYPVFPQYTFVPQKKSMPTQKSMSSDVNISRNRSLTLHQESDVLFSHNKNKELVNEEQRPSYSMYNLEVETGKQEIGKKSGLMDMLKGLF